MINESTLGDMPEITFHKDYHNPSWEAGYIDGTSTLSCRATRTGYYLMMKLEEQGSRSRRETHLTLEKEDILALRNYLNRIIKLQK